MTDTDDTDDLLLIPPDFFSIKSDSDHSDVVEPYYNIVDNLIKRVSNLQNRIKSIESSESFLSNSLDYSINKPHNMQNSIKGFRKYNSTDDLLVTSSAQSTPQKKNHTKFKLNSLPGSPYVDKFNTGRTLKEFKSPSKTSLSPRNDRKSSTPVKDGTINEIDTFLSKVKIIQRLNTVRNLENEFNTENDNNKPVERVLDDINQQQSLGNLQGELPLTKEKSWRLGDNKESVPDLGAGVRGTLYNLENNISGVDRHYDDGDKPSYDTRDQTKYFGNQSSLMNDSVTSVDRYPVSDSSTDSTRMTNYKSYSKSRSNLLNNPIHSNAINILNMHKQLLEDSGKKVSTKSKVREHKPRSTNTVNDNLGLMSLADIWNANSQLLHLNEPQLQQKLQEEKLRRQHCESLIQDLQNRNLEMQQKLSVALQVDESKNKVISQFQEALEKIISKMQALQKEKREWENEMSKIKTRHANDIEEASQKLTHYEKETSKALNSAHVNREKINSIEKKYSEMENEMHSIERKCKETEDKLAQELEKNKQLSEILSHKEIEINENKNTLNNARLEVSKSRKAVEICQEEFSKLKSESEKLHNDLENEKEQIEQLKQQKKELFNEINSYKKREHQLQEDVTKLKKQLENNKIELRNFYQGQVEILVQSKLKEFQLQLDHAETNFKQEIKKREMSIAKTAAMHIQQISEKYSLEIKLIEKKHQEEIKLHQIQIMQYKQQTDTLQNRLDQFQEKRVLIAKQLQKIMETQWSEALRIIASGKSPSFNEDSFSTIDQLNSLKTRSYNNVEEVLIQHEPFNLGKLQKDNQPVINNEEIVSSNRLSDKNPQEDPNVPLETPVSSRTQGNRQYNEHEIQKYINLLLNRPHGNYQAEGPSKEPDKGMEDSERASWSNGQADSIRSGSKPLKAKRFHKPPWK